MEQKTARALARKDLLKVKKALDKAGVRFFLMFGTLLGAVRDKDLILYDKDIDLGIFYEDSWKLEKAEKILEKHGILMEGKRRRKPDTPCEKFVLFGKTVWGIEFMTMYLIEDTYWHIDSSDWRGARLVPIKREHLDNLEEIDFLGTKFLIPSSPEKVLESWYGSNWRIPSGETRTTAIMPRELWKDEEGIREYEAIKIRKENGWH